MNLEDYKKKLAQHDWYYHFSDDHGVWQAGERSSREIFSIAQNGDDSFKKAYNEVYAAHFNTESFVTKDRPYVPPFKV